MDRLIEMSDEANKQNGSKGGGRPLGTGDARNDYFAVLGVRRSWHLDSVLLAERHLALSRELHPDRFAQSPPRERLLSLQRTTAINDAYRTLRDPIRRAEYILRLAGIGHQDRDLARGYESAGTGPEFLEEIMHIRERMMEAGLDAGRGWEMPEGQAIRAETAARIEELDRRIDERFSEWEAGSDGEGARQALLDIDRCLARRRYYANIVAEIDGEEGPARHG
jgi:molecular chaperone HscB